MDLKEVLSLLLAKDQAHLIREAQASLDDYKYLGTRDRLILMKLAEMKTLEEMIDSSSKLIKDYPPKFDFSPVPPPKEVIQEVSYSNWENFEDIGLAKMQDVALVLIAGGIGERLGFSQIKLSICPFAFIQHELIEIYCRQISNIQKDYHARFGSRIEIPLIVMTSESTDKMTRLLMKMENNYCLSYEQVTFLKQPDVLCFSSSGKIATGDGKMPIFKPGGHGAIHSLLHESKTASKLYEKGKRLIYFFQDTSYFAIKSLVPSLALQKADFTFLATSPTESMKQMGRLAVGSNSLNRVVNIEYNLIQESMKLSEFPGNVNQLLFDLESYIKVLDATNGKVTQHINPKLTSKRTFKRPVRPESMMQDLPTLADSNATYGIILHKEVELYARCKNSTDMSLTHMENHIYEFNRRMLRLIGIKVSNTVKVILFFSTIKGLRKIFPTPEKIEIADNSVLIVAGEPYVTIKGLKLNGCLRIICSHNTRVVLEDCECINDGGIKEEEPESELEKMRGVKCVLTKNCKKIKADDYEPLHLTGVL